MPVLSSTGNLRRYVRHHGLQLRRQQPDMHDGAQLQSNASWTIQGDIFWLEALEDFQERI